MLELHSRILVAEKLNLVVYILDKNDRQLSNLDRNEMLMPMSNKLKMKISFKFRIYSYLNHAEYTFLNGYRWIILWSNNTF